MKVLGIEVGDELMERWCGYLAPPRQPFFVGPDHAVASLDVQNISDLGDDARCTYTVWRVRDAVGVGWLDEDLFLALPRADRARLVRAQADLGRGAVPSVRRWRADLGAQRLRTQADGHRFVWWRSLLDQTPELVLRAHVEDGQLPSRHREVRARTWRQCEHVLPGAAELVGHFPEGSGPNCFGAVVAAANAGPVEARQVHEPFEEFLRERCRPGGHDDCPGTVLVWRDASSGLPSHAAITVGDGWGLEKPSETWWTPTIIATTRDLVRVNRSPGLQLERHKVLS